MKILIKEDYKEKNIEILIVFKKNLAFTNFELFCDGQN